MTLPQRRLHPLSPLLDAVTMAMRFWPALFALVINGSLRRAPLLIGLAALLAALAMLRWAMTSYGIGDDGQFRFSSGVLFRSERLVPLDRIQDVSQLRKLRHRALGVVALRIETAGGGGDSDVVLDFVTVAEAASLAKILRERSGVAQAGPILAASDRRLRLGPGLLALGGLTGAQLVAAPLALLGLLNQVADLPKGFEDSVSAISPAVGKAAGIAVLAVAAIAIAAVLPMIRYHGFVLERVGSDLTLQRGLLEQRAVTVPLARVQSVRVLANPARRLLGLVRVLVDTTARSAGDGNSRAEHLGIPILALKDLGEAIDVVAPDSAGAAQLTRHPPAARTLAALRGLYWLAPLALATGLGLGFSVGWPFALLGALLLLPVPAIAGASYRLLGHGFDGRYLWSRRGLFTVSTDIVALAKVQGAALMESPGQRRRSLCSVVVYLASRQPMVVLDVGRQTGTDLVGILTQRVQSQSGGVLPWDGGPQRSPSILH